MARKLMYEEKMYDYETRLDALEDIEKMKEKGWNVKDQYSQLNGKYRWTVEYHR